MTIVDSPGLIDLQPSSPAKQVIDNDVYQWFIDRSDVIYIVIDVSQLYLSNSLRVLLDQLKGSAAALLLHILFLLLASLALSGLLFA